MSKLKIGISSCLMGNKVRFDGGHKNSKHVQALLSEHAEFKTFCPEVAVGMTIPRPTIRLIKKEDVIDVVEPKSGKSYLKDMLDYADNVDFSDLDGIIFKKDSPSCGAFRVKVYSEKGNKLEISGEGAFAGKIMKRYPDIPIEEEGRLTNPLLKDNFINRVTLFSEVKKVDSISALILFHSRNKFLFYSYDQIFAKELGGFLASYKKGTDFDFFKSLYISLMMQKTEKPPKKSNHVNAMMHIYGFIKNSLTKEEKQSVAELIMSYNNNKSDLIEPLSVLRFLVKHKGNEYIKAQSFLSNEMS